MTKELKDRLPDKLSDLVDLAADDWERIDREVYWPASGMWLQDTGDGKCGACDAGAVMAGTMEIPEDGRAFMGHPHDIHQNGHMNSRDVEKLLALNEVRMGNYRSALLDWMLVDVNKVEAADLSKVPLAKPIHFSGWGDIGERIPGLRAVAAALRSLGF